MKHRKIKKLLIIIATSIGLVATAYTAQQVISLNSPTTFPVDI